MKYLISYTLNIVNQGQASEWGIDEVLSWGDGVKKDLSNLPQNKESMVFFIPTVFNHNNSLSYEGANLAVRILMRYLRNGRTDIDIVLMGNETELNFLLHYDYPNILKIPGFHYIRFNKKTASLYQLPWREQLKVDEYKPYVDNLGLKIPSSFKSTHSLTNEWCLFKWDSFMGFNENTSALEDCLYFDYLITIEKLNRVRNKTVSTYLKNRIQNFPSTRILLIDDKVGWHRFFKDMFHNSTKVDIHCLGEDFSKLDFVTIRKRIIDEVNDFKPHIIILDFRLMEDKDAEIRGNMKEISGYKVLAETIKGTYKRPLESFGRQVLIFTATSRIENIMMLREGNADGFILKEKPENYNGKDITKDVISKMVSTLETAGVRAEFLIPLNIKLQNLVEIVSIPQYAEKLKLREEVVATAESIRLITQNNEISKDVLKLIYLDIFKIFENIKKDSGIVDYPNDFSLTIRANKDLTVCSKGKSGIYQKSDDDWNCTHKFVLSSTHERFCKERSLNFAMCAIILFRLGYKRVDDTNWNTIRIIRNELTHGEHSQPSKKNVDLSVPALKEYSLKMLDLIAHILDPKYIQEVVPNLSN